MKTLVIYDSVYGNTEKIAKAIAGELSCPCLRVSDATHQGISSIELLIVGSPTHGGNATPAMQKFMDGLPKDALKGKLIAAFDTWISKEGQNLFMRGIIGIFGHASPRLASVLQKAGGKIHVQPEGFLVKGKEGPLVEGELERAAAWAKGLAKN